MNRIIALSMLLAATALGTPLPNSYIGVPNPNWTWDRTQPALPDPWTSGQSPYYYVNPQTGDDTGNTFGDPTAPRATIPAAPAAGSVIVLAGTFAGAQTWNDTGTDADPIWIVADNPAAKPVFSSLVTISGSYYIVDALDFRGVDGALRFTGGDHITVTNSVVTDTDQGNGAAVGGAGDFIVFIDNTVGPVGDYQFTGPDTDHHGWKLEGNDVWAISSTFFQCQGDGIQVGDVSNDPADINRVYIAGNTAHSNLQSGFWLKNCTDVIISQNTIYDHSDVDGGSVPVGSGGQYDFGYGWWIANLIYDCGGGIQIGSGNLGGGDDRYIIGNVIRDTTSTTFNFDNPHSIAGIGNRGGSVAECRIIFNTLQNNQGGINAPNQTNTHVIGNIIGEPTEAGARHVYSTDAASTTGTLNYNFYVGSTQVIRWGTANSTLAGIQSATIQEDNGIAAADALYVNEASDNLRLQAVSPAVDTGPASDVAFATFLSRYGIDISQDFAGVSRPQGGSWDIGAYEFTTATGTLNAGTIIVGPQP